MASGTVKVLPETTPGPVALSDARILVVEALAGGVEVAPVLQVDLSALTAYLEGVRAGIDLPPVNAGVRLVDGRAEASPPADGRALDVAATVARVGANAPGELAALALGQAARGDQELAPETIATSRCSVFRTNMRCSIFSLLLASGGSFICFPQVTGTTSTMSPTANASA